MSSIVAPSMIVAAYLLGSISWSVLVVRVLRGVDVRTVGSGNAGATNVLRAAGKGPALATLVLDAGKGAAAVLTARLLDGGPWVVGLVAVAVVVGHVYPLYFGFRGGKGVATAGGALFALDWRPTLAALGVFVLTLAWRRIVSLSSISAAAAIPLLVLAAGMLGLFGDDRAWLALFTGTLLIAALVIFKHRANLARLRAGTEPRLGERA